MRTSRHAGSHRRGRRPAAGRADGDARRPRASGVRGGRRRRGAAGRGEGARSRRGGGGPQEAAPPTPPGAAGPPPAAPRSAGPGGGLVFSQYIETRYATRLLEGNASGIGYLLKDRVADVAEFSGALERVACGGTALDPEVVSQLLGASRRSTGLASLTARERDVL